MFDRTNKQIFQCIFTTLLLLILPMQAWGQTTVYWVSTSNPNWSTSSNWDGGSVPGANDNVIIPGSAPVNPQISSNVTINSLTVDFARTVFISDGVTLAISGNLTTNDANGISLTGTLQTGIIELTTTATSNVITNATSLPSINFSGSGTLNFTDNLIFSNDATFNQSDPNSTVNFQGTVNMHGGTFSNVVTFNGNATFNNDNVTFNGNVTFSSNVTFNSVLPITINFQDNLTLNNSSNSTTFAIGTGFFGAVTVTIGTNSANTLDIINNPVTFTGNSNTTFTINSRITGNQDIQFATRGNVTLGNIGSSSDPYSGQIDFASSYWRTYIIDGDVFMTNLLYVSVTTSSSITFNGTVDILGIVLPIIADFMNDVTIRGDSTISNNAITFHQNLTLAPTSAMNFMIDNPATVTIGTNTTDVLNITGAAVTFDGTSTNTFTIRSRITGNQNLEFNTAGAVIIGQIGTSGTFYSRNITLLSSSHTITGNTFLSGKIFANNTTFQGEADIGSGFFKNTTAFQDNVTFHDSVSFESDGTSITVNFLANLTLAPTSAMNFTIKNLVTVTIGSNTTNELNITGAAVTFDGVSTNTFTIRSRITGNQALTFSTTGRTVEIGQIGIPGTSYSGNITLSSAVIFQGSVDATSGTFKDNVTFRGVGTAVNFHDNITLAPTAPMSFTINNSPTVTIGTNTNNILNITGAAVTFTGDSTNTLTINSRITGNQNLTFSTAGRPVEISHIGDPTPYSANITFTSSITSASSTTSLTINSSAALSVGDIGTSTHPFSTITVTASSIILTGSIYSNNNQRYNTLASGTDNGTRLMHTANASIDANGAGMVEFDDLYVLISTGIEVDFNILSNTLSMDSFIFYQGIIDINSTNSSLIIEASENIVILGADYNDADPERASANEWKYPAALSYDPGTSYSAVFGSNVKSAAKTLTLTGAGNFYLNGADLTFGGTLNLSLPDNTNSNPLTNAPWGAPFAILLNTTVQNCQVITNTIIEAFTRTATSGTVSSVRSTSNGGIGNSVFTYKKTIPQPVAPAYAAITKADLIASYGIDFDRTYIMAAETIRSDLIKLTFNRPVLNAGNAIDTRLMGTNITIGGAAMNVAARLDGDTAPVLSINANDLTQDTTTYYALKEFYIQIPNTHTFRTDATGSAAANAANGGLGGSNSTNTQGNQGNPTAIAPDISFAKGIFFGSNGADLVTAMSSGSNTFNTTSDGIPPVLLEILVGRKGDTSDARSYHNYFKLRYSEPVAFGDADGTVIGDSSTEDAVQDLQYAAGTTFVNAAVSTDPLIPNFSPGTSGGEIINNTGTITVSGIFSYTNTNQTYQENSVYHMIKGSTDGNPNIDLLYKPRDTELEIILAGRMKSSTEWAGWVFNVLDPYAAGSITLIENPNITDRAGQTINLAENQAYINNINSTIPRAALVTDFKPDPDPNIATDFWDVSPPGISAYHPDTTVTPPLPGGPYPSPNYEIVTRDSDNNQLIDTFDIFVQDNFLSRSWDYVQGQNNPEKNIIWDSSTDHPDTRQIPTAADSTTMVTPPRGIRDNSLADIGAFFFASVNENIQNATPASDSSFTTSFSTSVINDHFKGTINVSNDQYFSLAFDETAENWIPDSVIYIAYNATAGLITDLAGNLMPPSGFGSPAVFPSPPLIPNNFVLNPYEDFSGENGKIFSTDKFPPLILTTLGAVGGTRLYMKFNEPVLDDSTSPTAITASNFSLSWGASINDIEIISSENIRGANAATEIYLNLGSPLSIENIFDGNINISAINNIRDIALNPYDTSIARETSDVLLGVIEPVWAMNSIVGGNSSFSTIRNFDGSEYLLNADITIESVILSNVAQYTSLPVKLYYDVNVAETKRFDSGFWSVFSIPGLIDDVNVLARNARQLADDGHITRDLIPGDDGEIQPGVTLEFLYSIGGKMTASIDNPNHLLSLRPWSLDIEQLVEQRGNTTVANNVINPENGDSAVIYYELERAGTVIISIFTVDNDLVRILQRSRAGEGQHSIVWDGTNAGNTIVAPGFYFIRVVAPGIDETRKVLVVKP